MAKQLKKPSLSRGASSIWSFKAGLIGGLALLLAACGFQPIHKYDGGMQSLQVAVLEVTGDGSERALARNLGRRISIEATVDMRVSIGFERVVTEMQRGADGIARRLQVTHHADMRVQRGDRQIMERFSLTQYMTRGDSAADEMKQMRALDDLAARDLAARLIAFLGAESRGGDSE